MLYEVITVPIPCAATPVAKPRARQSVRPSALSMGVTKIAPIMPVSRTRTAVSVGCPPRLSEMPIATGAVADFGASVAISTASAPSSFAIPIV